MPLFAVGASCIGAAPVFMPLPAELLPLPAAAEPAIGGGVGCFFRSCSYEHARDQIDDTEKGGLP